MSLSERVSFFEAIYDELSAAAFKKEGLSENLQNKMKLLEEYYTSGEWRADYEADEAGEFPPELKRGVLSQDAVYDLLTELD